jgi:urease accessory protein
MTARPTLPLPTLERARGQVDLTVSPRATGHAIVDLAQSGCGRLLFPRVANGAPLEAVIVNTSGGLTGGDRFAASLAVEGGGSLVATTQACEKVYRSDGADTVVETRLRADRGGELAWLPQETILFDRARLKRRLAADLAGDATLFLVEAVLLGRKASGETFREGHFCDSWRIRRGGRLVFAEEMRLGGDVARVASHRATLSGGAAFATILLAGADAPVLREAQRRLIGNEAGEGGSSLFDGLCVARLVAQDGAALRGILLPLIKAVGRGVPRVWSL